VAPPSAGFLKRYKVLVTTHLQGGSTSPNVWQCAAVVLVTTHLQGGSTNSQFFVEWRAVLVTTHLQGGSTGRGSAV